MRSAEALTPLVAVLLCLLCLGFALTASIVSREGVGGVFKRKRAALKRVMPEAIPVLDRIEERSRKAGRKIGLGPR